MARDWSITSAQQQAQRQAEQAQQIEAGKQRAREAFERFKAERLSPSAVGTPVVTPGRSEVQLKGNCGRTLVGPHVDARSTGARVAARILVRVE